MLTRFSLFALCRNTYPYTSVARLLSSMGDMKTMYKVVSKLPWMTHFPISQSFSYLTFSVFRWPLTSTRSSRVLLYIMHFTHWYGKGPCFLSCNIAISFQSITSSDLWPRPNTTAILSQCKTCTSKTWKVSMWFWDGRVNMVFRAWLWMASDHLWTLPKISYIRVFFLNI